MEVMASGSEQVGSSLSICKFACFMNPLESLNDKTAATIKNVVKDKCEKLSKSQ